MSFDTVVWHFYLGYAILGMLGFRLVWGFVGPTPVRWRNLIPRMSDLVAYINKLGERRPSGSPGHNPLGSLSVLTLLLLLAAQAGTGLFIESEDFFEVGPLYSLVSESVVDRLTWWHHFMSKVLLAVVMLHLAAIFYYRFWKGEDLITPMITGWKWVKNTTDNE
jgi:cytochrome b